MKNFLKNYFTPDEQKILIFLLIFGFLGISLKFWGMKIEDKKLSADFDSLKAKNHKIIKVDIRTANKELLTSIPGIGPKKAEQIINYRNKVGFEKTSDITKIKGIGQKTYLKLKKYLVDFNEQNKNSQDAINKKIDMQKKINLNEATYEDLISIKGIGPKKAKAILQLKEKLGGKFKDLNQLTEIKGIGKKTVEKLKNYLTVKDK